MGGKSWQQGTSRQRVGEEPRKVQTTVFIEVSRRNNFWKKVVKKSFMTGIKLRLKVGERSRSR